MNEIASLRSQSRSDERLVRINTLFFLSSLRGTQGRVNLLWDAVRAPQATGQRTAKVDI